MRSLSVSERVMRLVWPPCQVISPQCDTLSGNRGIGGRRSVTNACNPVGTNQCDLEKVVQHSEGIDWETKEHLPATLKWGPGGSPRLLVYHISVVSSNTLLTSVMLKY